MDARRSARRGHLGTSRTRQTSIDLHTHGGARKGAGRKPAGGKRRVSHAKRGALGGAVPVLITMKLLHGVSNLRSRARCKVVLRALKKASDRLGTRLVEWSVQHDHIHIALETKDGSSLSRAMQGL